MSPLRFCLLIAVLCGCSELGYSEVSETKIILLPPQHKEAAADTPLIIDTPVIPDTTPTPSTTSTTPASTTTSTTPKPTTTSTTPKPTTTSTTPKPTTTSTTPKPTTTTATPDTTTPTTTTTTPHPTPAPGPLPPPTQGTWSFTDAKSNATCIVVQFAAQLNVTYTKVVDNATRLWDVLINVPANSTVTGGNCTGDQWLTLSWWTTANASYANNITLVFHKNKTTKDYALKSLNVSLTPDNFVNGSFTGPVEFWHGAEWDTPLATSYRCKATQLNMTSVSGNLAAALTLTRLQEEAYRTAPGTGFSAARECGGGDVPDAVPIAVGCALGGLVVVVLVAYLVGRRRSAARGYLSM